MVDELPHFALPDLRSEVFSLLSQIPRGCVATYGDLARALGDEKTRSARWLGEFLKSHPHGEHCPCHRVVRSSGELGLHVSGDSRRKGALLRAEGVPVSESGQVDLSRRTCRFRSSRPLEELRSFQRELGRRMRQVPLTGTPGSLAGLDVAYRADGLAHGAYVELDARSLQVIRKLTLTMAVEFPYIPGYLAFREMPVMLRLAQSAREQGGLADLLFVDGNGLLHPWRAGIATCVGVMLDHPTIGIGKSLLCGSVDLWGMEPEESRPVCDGDERIGLALKTNARSRPVYASPGHRVTMQEAADESRRTMTTHRVPEPIFYADRLSKTCRKSTD